ncbi:phage holin family protein [Oceanobacillus halophilus]|uniref:Holin n=1 Tax=Oceanobacillus halophilus TaxID=930130 RepID=A0A494ZVK7_9BACI|nr:phage holin family protein [Oceanobacillus halophilus]RKQ30382.1 hypothetical protein D8M06_15850 [Oceanobacillus halophilus]
MDLLRLYIYPETFILIPALYFIGLILDQTPVIPKWIHAWIKLIFAVSACLLYYGFDIRAVVQGVLVTGTEMVFRDIIHNTIVGIYERKTEQSNIDITKRNGKDE